MNHSPLCLTTIATLLSLGATWPPCKGAFFCSSQPSPVLEKEQQHRSSSFDGYIQARELENACINSYGNRLAMANKQRMAQNEKDMTLIEAVLKPCPPQVKLLLSEGANPNKIFFGGSITTYLITRYTSATYWCLHPEALAQANEGIKDVSYLVTIQPPSFFENSRQCLTLLISAKGFLNDEEIEALKEAPQELREVVEKTVAKLKQGREKRCTIS